MSEILVNEHTGAVYELAVTVVAPAPTGTAHLDYFSADSEPEDVIEYGRLYGVPIDSNPGAGVPATELQDFIAVDLDNGRYTEASALRVIEEPGEILLDTEYVELAREGVVPAVSDAVLEVVVPDEGTEFLEP